MPNRQKTTYTNTKANNQAVDIAVQKYFNNLANQLKLKSNINHSKYFSDISKSIVLRTFLNYVRDHKGYSYENFLKCEISKNYNTIEELFSLDQPKTFINNMVKEAYKLITILNKTDPDKSVKEIEESRKFISYYNTNLTLGEKLSDKDIYNPYEKKGVFNLIEEYGFFRTLQYLFERLFKRDQNFTKSFKEKSQQFNARANTEKMMSMNSEYARAEIQSRQSIPRKYKKKTDSFEKILKNINEKNPILTTLTDEVLKEHPAQASNKEEFMSTDYFRNQIIKKANQYNKNLNIAQGGTGFTSFLRKIGMTDIVRTSSARMFQRELVHELKQLEKGNNNNTPRPGQ